MKAKSMEGGSSQPWNHSSLQTFERIIDKFQKYPNTAGFFVGNSENVVSTGYGFGGQFLPNCLAVDTTNMNRG